MSNVPVRKYSVETVDNLFVVEAQHIEITTYDILFQKFNNEVPYLTFLVPKHEIKSISLCENNK